MPLTRTVNLQRQNNGETNTTNLDPITYNSRYPGLDEYNYKKLESKVDNLGLSGYDKEKAMDEGYIQVLPLVQNNIKNSDRRKYINQARYEVSQIQDPDAKLQAKAKLSVTEISQLIKEKYNVDPSANDEEVFNSWINTIPNGGQLLADYMNGKSKDLLYEGGLKTNVVEEKPMDTTQGGIKGRIADAGSNTEEGGILPDTWELVNPIGYLTEALDTLGQKGADYITVGKGAREDLVKKINELSDEDLEQYRKRYKNSGYQGSFEDYIIDTNKTMWQDLVGADEELKGIAEPNVFKFFGNMPASTLRLVTASLKNVTNPFDVGKGLGKMFATEEGRDALYNRYLTAEGWANALNYDPVGTADEVLSVANSFGSLLKNTGKLTRLNGVENAGNWISNNVGSPFDVAVDRALNGGDITTSKNFIEDWKNTDASLTNPKFKNGYTPDLQTTNVKGLYGTLDDTLGKKGKLGGAVNRYLQDTSSVGKLIENAGEDVKALKQKANTWADEIIQNNNRMTKKQQENFKKMSGEDQGKWMNDRNIRTQEELVDYFLESKNKVDDAMGKIEGQFTSKELTTVLDDSIDFAKKTENKDLSRLQELQTKNANGGLTMQEINEVKRFYEKNNKFNYLKEGTAEKSALATNRDTALREWQQKVAADNGLTNLKELNKETQAAKYLSDNATNWQSGVKGNNPISLTDWIVASGGGFDINGIKNVVGKKIFSSPRFQDKLVDVLNYIGGHETKGEINPNYQAIDMKNYEKRILAEELAQIKNEKDFNEWLEKAEYMAGPALPYNPRYDGQAPIDYSTPTVVTPGGQSIRPGQIADI